MAKKRNTKNAEGQDVSTELETSENTQDQQNGESTIEPMQPIVVESKVATMPVLNGDCLIEIISGPDKGKQFTTSIQTARKYYSDESLYQIIDIKKNQ